MKIIPIRPFLTACALTVPILAYGDGGWRVTALAGESDASRGGMRTVYVAVSDPDGKSVTGLGKGSFVFQRSVCSEPQVQGQRPACNYTDAVLGGVDQPPIEDVVSPGLYVLHVANAEGILALRVLQPINTKVLLPGNPGPTAAQRQMAILIVPEIQKQ